ncbi:MAG: ATPase, partial [Catenulispora sp.]|nr:ATPase [Catenulispora sp.]
MSAAILVAADGGNSKTDVVLADADGAVLASVRGPGSSPHLLGVPGSIALLDDLIRQARAQAGLPVDLELARAEVYLAGADLPAEVDILMAAAAKAGWAAAHRVDNDTFALLRAGTDAPDAIAVVCGAGINCVGRNAAGESARFPALGPITGDWGGGH